jgi:regulator of protease activity HflC (stomatin/prohibitin superfamily)
MNGLGNVILALLLVAAAAGMVIAILRSMRFQQEGRVGVVETFGRFSRVVLPGRYFLWPWDNLRAEVPLQMFVFETEEESLLTKSGSSVKLRMVVFYQLAHVGRNAHSVEAPRVVGSAPLPRGSNLAPGMVARVGLAPGGSRRVVTAGGAGAVAVSAPHSPLAPEPNFMSRIMGRRQFVDVEHAAYRAVYTVEDWRALTEKEAVDILHQTFAKLDVAKDLFGNDNWQGEVAEQLRTHLNEKTLRWGVEIHEINFKEVQFHEITMKNLFAEARAEREARLRRIEARTQKEIGDLLGLDAEGLLRLRYIDAMRELAQNSQARLMFSNGMPSSPMPMITEETPPQNALPPGNIPAFPPPTPTAAPPTLPDGSPAADPNRNV